MNNNTELECFLRSFFGNIEAEETIRGLIIETVINSEVVQAYMNEQGIFLSGCHDALLVYKDVKFEKPVCKKCGRPQRLVIIRRNQ